MKKDLKKERGFEELLDKSLKGIFKSSIIVFAVLVFSKVFSYIYKIIIARTFGPEFYGLFSLLVVISGWLIAFSSLGLSDGLLRFIPLFRAKKQEEKIRYLFRFSAKVQLVSSIITAIILFFIADYLAINLFHNLELGFFLKVFSFFLPISVIAYLFLSIMRGSEKVTAFVLTYNLVPNFSRFLFLLFFVYLGFLGGAIVFSYCLGIAIMLMVAYIFCKNRLPELFLKVKIKEDSKSSIRKELFSYSFPLLFFSIISAIFYWIDSISIGYLKSATEVGIYNAAVPIAMLLGMTVDLFNQLFFPMITRQYSNKKMDLVKSLSKNVTKWVFMINLPAFILFFFFPGVLIKLLFGVEYLGASNALRILLIGTFFSSITFISSNLLYTIGKSKIALSNLIISCIVNVTLNFILIPREFILGFDNSNGLIGAALATVISMVILGSLSVIQAAYYTRIFPFSKRIIRIALLLVVPFILLFYFQTKLNMTIITAIILTLGFLLVYLIFLLLFKGLDSKDKMIFRAIFKKIHLLNK
jgi:O-antigen/teichoic acid export membrane protein